MKKREIIKSNYIGSECIHKDFGCNYAKSFLSALFSSTSVIKVLFVVVKMPLLLAAKMPSSGNLSFCKLCM